MYLLEVIRIGIPIQEITEVRLFTSTSDKSTIFLKTSERFTVWIRDTLGMSKSEIRQGFYSPRSKCKLQRVLERGDLKLVCLDCNLNGI